MKLDHITEAEMVERACSLIRKADQATCPEDACCYAEAAAKVCDALSILLGRVTVKISKPKVSIIPDATFESDS